MAVRLAVVAVATATPHRGDLCVYATPKTLTQHSLRAGAYAFVSRDDAAAGAAAHLVRVDLWTPTVPALATTAEVGCVQVCAALAVRLGLPCSPAAVAAAAVVPSAAACDRALWITLRRPALTRAELPVASRVMIRPVAAPTAAVTAAAAPPPKVGGPLSLVQWTAALQRILSTLLSGRVVAVGQTLSVDWLGRPAYAHVTLATGPTGAGAAAAAGTATAATAAGLFVIAADTQTHVDMGSGSVTTPDAPRAVAAEAQWLRAVTTAVCGVEREARELVRAVREPLVHAAVYDGCGVWAPHCFLLHGLPGTGKTALAHAVAQHSGLYVEHVQGASLYSKYQGDSELLLSAVFDRARARAPAVVVVDELDALCPAAADAATAETESGGVEQRVVTQLRALLDTVNRPHSAASEGDSTASSSSSGSSGASGSSKAATPATPTRPHVFVIATTNRLFGVDASLRCSGRFERLIELTAPNAAARLAILSRHCHALPFAAAAPAAAAAAAGPDVAATEKRRVLSLVAERTHGFVGADLERLCREVVLLAMRRLKPLSATLPVAVATTAATDSKAATPTMAAVGSVAPQQRPALALSEADFVAALMTARPSNLASTEFGVVPPPAGARPIDAQTSLSAAAPDPFARLGGLNDVIARLRAALVVPLSDPARYARYGLRPPRGVLLYGPSGCGKTALAMAAAAACRAHALTVHATQLVSAVVGESERAVRALFAQARASAPCVLVIEQIEVLAPRRVSRTDRTAVSAAASASAAATDAAVPVAVTSAGIDAPATAAAEPAAETNKFDFKFDVKSDLKSDAKSDADTDATRDGNGDGNGDDDDDGDGEGGATQFDRILSALLTEMDGVLTPGTTAAAEDDSDDDTDASGAAERRRAAGPTPPPAVVVIATSAFPQRLDPAILRSGRLDTHLFVPPPDAAARFDILQKLMPQLPPPQQQPSGSAAVSAVTSARDDREALLRWMSVKTAGWTSAKLASVCRDAAFSAFRRSVAGAGKKS